MVRIQAELQRERLAEEKGVLPVLKLVIGRAKCTFGGRNVENENRVQLENLKGDESEAHALEMQAEQNEEIVAIVGKTQSAFRAHLSQV